MLGYIVVTIFFAIMVLLFCWFLLHYLYHVTGRISEKELNKLRFKNKVLFHIARFWKLIGEGRKYHKEQLKDSAIASNDTVSIEKFKVDREGNTPTCKKKRKTR